MAFCHSLRGTADPFAPLSSATGRTAGEPPGTSKECGWTLAPATRRSRSCRSAGNASSSSSRLASQPGRTIDPARLALVPLGGGEAMLPTRTTVDGDRLTVRFNVMVGPGLAPLAVGRWTLRSQVALDDPAAVDPATASGVFPLTTGLYTVAPAFTPTPGSGAAPQAPSRSTSRTTRTCAARTRPRSSRSGSGPPPGSGERSSGSSCRPRSCSPGAAAGGCCSRPGSSRRCRATSGSSTIGWSSAGSTATSTC